MAIILLWNYLRVKGIFFRCRACPQFCSQQSPGARIIIDWLFQFIENMVTIWHWQEKTVKISLGVVRRRFKIFFFFFFCTATCCAETIARLAGCCNNSRAVCQTSPRFAELETCFNVTRKKKKKSRGNQRKIKINSPCSCLYVCSLSLSLSPMSAPARTRTYRLVVVICLILLLYCAAPAWHERPPSQRWNFVFFCYSPFYYFFPPSSNSVYSHPFEQRRNECTYTQSIE